MSCANCGADNPSESVYCGRCGSPLASNTEMSTALVSSSDPEGGSVTTSAEEDMPTMHSIPPAEENPPINPETPTPIEQETTTPIPSPEDAPVASQQEPVSSEEQPTMRFSSPEDAPIASQQEPAGDSVSSEEQPTMRFSSPEDAPVASQQEPVSSEEQPTMRIPSPEDAPNEERPIEDTPTIRDAPGASEFFQFDSPGSQSNQEAAFQHPHGVITQKLSNETAGAPLAPNAPGIPPAYGAYPPMAPGYPGQQLSGAYPPVTPGYPGQQLSGAYPPVTPGYPGQQLSGAYPPMAPGYPGQQASGAYPPVTPGYPGQQLSGTYPQMGTGQLPQSGWPAYGVPQTPQTPREPSALIKPLPLWIFIGSIVVVALILGLLTFFTGPDWAAGAQTAGIIALIIGILILIAFAARSFLGLLAPTNTHRRTQVISALLLALLLFVAASVGLGQQSGFHSLQARTLEGQQNWQSAINEYKASGQSAPTSVDLARVYNEWGEQLSSQQQFEPALTKFTTVLTTYNQATDQVTTAQKDTISLYEAWANVAVQQHNYPEAVQRYDTLIGLSYCFSDCQSKNRAADATAYYNLAEQQLGSQNYTNAVTAFQKLSTNFSSSPEAQRIHADYAKALWGEAQQQINTTCTSALSTYQQLATNFADTTEGQEATQALKAPVHVKGHFTGVIPAASTTPIVILNKGKTLTSSTSDTDLQTILTNSPVTKINSDGTFAFTGIATGQYQFIWGTLTDSDGFLRLRFDVNPTTIGQLCTYDFGDLTDEIPAS